MALALVAVVLQVVVRGITPAEILLAVAVMAPLLVVTLVLVVNLVLVVVEIALRQKAVAESPLLMAVAQVVALDLVAGMEPALAEIQIAQAAATLEPIQVPEQVLAVVRGLMVALTEQRAVDQVEHLVAALMEFLAGLVMVLAEAVRAVEAPAV